MSTVAGDYRYSAFISYRHTEGDMQVAKEVHRKLERYHLDRDVRQHCGRTSLAPIFRDQDELPISSALDDDLLDALHNSSALIVICSPRLKLSKWCLREVDEFLRTHDRSRVFVVLQEGEPADVVPDQLLHRMGPDGTMQDVEPLAADFRPEVKGPARRNEVTRLVAGILGVPYDSLVKRAQRRRQRIAAALGTAAVAVSTAFGIYNAYMNTQIRTNYLQALRRRSEYLATEANLLIDEGNTLGAIELCLAALPDDGSAESAARPVVPDAVYALQQATNAGLSEMLYDYSFTTNEVYSSGADLVQLNVSPSERYVSTLDKSQEVQTWDVTDHRLVYGGRAALGQLGDVRDAFVLDTGDTIVCHESGVVCRAAQDGSETWCYELPEGSTLEQACLDEDKRPHLLVLTADEAHVLEAETGRELWKIPFADYTGLAVDGNTWTALVGRPSAKGSRFVMALSAGGPDGFERCLALTIDAKTGEVRTCEAPGLYAFRMALLRDGSVVMLLGTDPSAQASNRDQFFATTYTNTLDFDVRLACLDGSDGTVRWTHDLSLWQVCFDIGFEEVLDGVGGEPTGTLACWFADRVLYVDERTGEVAAQLKTASSIVGAGLVAGSAYLSGVQTDGSYFMVSPQSPSVGAYRFMGSDLYYAKVLSTGQIYLLDGNMLLAYRGVVVDDSVVQAEVEAHETAWEFAAKEGFVLATMPTERDVLRVELRDPASLDLAWSTEFGEDDELIWYVMDFDEGADALYVLGMAHEDGQFVMRRLARVSMAAQQVDQWNLQTSAETGLKVSTGSGAPAGMDGLVVGNSACIAGGTVYSQVVDADGTVGIAAASLDAGTTCCYGVAEGFGRKADRSGRRLYLMVDPTGTRLLYQDKDAEQSGDSGLETHRSALLDLATGASEVLPTGVASIWEGKVASRALNGHAVWSADGQTIAYVTPESVVLHRLKRGSDVEIPVDGARVAGVCLASDRAIVALSLGTTSQLESYDLATGAQLAMSTIDDGGMPACGWTEVPVARAADGAGGLFMTTPRFGYLLDPETLHVCQRFVGGCAYDPQADALLCRGAEGGSYHAHARYTLARLLERGRQVLGQQTMGQDWLSAHGA